MAVLTRWPFIKRVLLIRKLQTELLFGPDKVTELNEVAVRWGDTVCVYNNSVKIIIQQTPYNRLRAQG